MKLETYIQERRITHGDAARQMGISRQYLNEIVNGKRVPGRAVAFKVVKWSSGMVRLEDLWPEMER